MGMRMTATVEVEFEMEEGQPENLAELVLRRETSEFQNRIERGTGIGRTGVKHGSAKVVISSQVLRPD